MSIMAFKTFDIPYEDEFQCLNGLKLIRKNLMVLWYRRKARFFCLNLLLNKTYSATLPSEITDIVAVNHDIIFLAEDGLVYVSTLKEETNRIPQQKLDCQELGCAKDVLSICSTSNGLAILNKFGEISVLNQNSELEMSNFAISIMFTIPCKDSHEFLQNDCCMLVFRSSDFHPIFCSLLFRETALIDCEILFIALGNGNILWIPLLSTAKEDDFRLLFNASSSVRGVIASGGEQPKQYDRIIILTSDGSINVIRCDIPGKQLKYDRLYLPSVLKSFCFTQDNVFHSDGLNLWRSHIIGSKDGKLSLTSQLLHIKGVIGLENINNGQHVIVGCKHALLYKIDCSTLTSEPKADDFKVHRTTKQDGAELLAEMELASQEMLALREALLTENKLLHEISIAARADLFKGLLEVKVEVSEDDGCEREKFVVKVTNTSQQEFSNEFWSIHMNFMCGSWNSYSMQKLPTFLKPGNTVAFCLDAKIPDFSVPVFLDSSLVLIFPSCTIQGQEYGKLKSLEIPLERQILGIPYFLSPVASEGLTYIQDSEGNEKETCENLVQRFIRSTPENHPPSALNSKSLLCYTFRLPEIMSWESFIEEILKKSRHKFQGSFLGESEFKVQVLHSVVTLQYNSEDSIVKVYCSNMDILNKFKDFILNTVIAVPDSFSGDVVCVCLEENDLVRIANMSALVDYYGDLDMKSLRGMKSQLRDFTSSRLPL